jgi:hypothetical protein
VRRRYRYDSQTKELIEVPWDSKQEALAPVVWDDLPAYESPIDGRVIEGRRQRRNDLARSNCRPYEGKEQELKEARRRLVEQDRREDQLAEKMAHRAWAEAPERIRKLFRGR